MDMSIVGLLIVVGVILVSMTVHEAMHGYVAYWLGDDTAQREGRLTLNPIKHLDPFLSVILPLLLALTGGPIFGGAKPVPFNPSLVRYGDWGAALVAIAGPLTNFLLAFLAAAFYFLFELQGSSLIGQICMLAIQINLGFFLFNIIPIPPLDGSRVLYALAPGFVRSIMEQMERFGLIVVFLIILFASPVVFRYMTGAIDFFLSLFESLF